MPYRQMREENMRIRNKDYAVYDYDEEERGPVNTVDEPEEEEEQTLKPSSSYSPTRDAIMARKMQQADARVAEIQYDERRQKSNFVELCFSQTMRTNAAEAKQRGRSKMKKTNRFESFSLRCSDPEPPAKANPNAAPIDYDSRPITPMRASYGQVAGRYAGDDESPSNTERSPTRQQRVMSSSQRSTMNSMSHTIDARYAAKPKADVKPMSPSHTIGSLRARQKTFVDDSKTIDVCSSAAVRWQMIEWFSRCWHVER